MSLSVVVSVWCWDSLSLLLHDSLLSALVGLGGGLDGGTDRTFSSTLLSSIFDEEVSGFASTASPTFSGISGIFSIFCGCTTGIGGGEVGIFGAITSCIGGGRKGTAGLANKLTRDSGGGRVGIFGRDDEGGVFNV